MNKIIDVDIVFQDYSDCDSGLPSHWVAIVRHTGSGFPEHVYADTEEELSHLKVGEEFPND